MPMSESGDPIVAHTEATLASVRENVMAMRARTPENLRWRRLVDILEVRPDREGGQDALICGANDRDSSGT